MLPWRPSIVNTWQLSWITVSDSWPNSVPSFPICPQADNPVRRGDKTIQIVGKVIAILRKF